MNGGKLAPMQFNPNNHAMKVLTQILLFFSVIACATFAYGALLVAQVDRTVVGEDETVQLTVRIDEQVGVGSPNFKQLEQQFEVLSLQPISQYRNINGRAEAWTEWHITLAPKHSGQLLIPSFNYKGAHSDAISIKVTPVSNAITGEVPDIFLETKVDKTDIYVQEQILLTVRVHSALNLREISEPELELPDTVVVKVAENDLRRQIQGRTYFVREYVYALYPQKSDQLKIPSLTWTLATASTNRGWFDDPFRSPRGSIRRLHTDAQTIDVKPKPNNYPYTEWMPAKNVSLDEHWSRDPSEFKVGEPITRTITLTAEELTSAQLPPLPDQSTDGVKLYADQAQLDDEKKFTGVTGRRIESVAIVPTDAGTLTLPAVQVGWWDTAAQQPRVATIPAKTIMVSGVALPDVALTPTLNTSSENEDGAPVRGGLSNVLLAWPWIIATAFSIAMALWFFFAWLRLRQQLTPAQDGQQREQAINVKKAAQRVRRACADQQPQRARHALIQWAQLYWRDSRITNLQTIAQRCNDEDIAKELAELDEILYGNLSEGAWKGARLWTTIYAYTKRKQTAADSNNELPPLYPVS